MRYSADSLALFSPASTRLLTPTTCIRIRERRVTLVGSEGAAEMADTDVDLGNGLGSNGNRWQGRLVGGLLVVGGVLHCLRPSWFTLDWPSIVIILVGVALLFVPLDDLGAVIESIEFGKNKILFRNTDKLRSEVKVAIGSAELENPTEKTNGIFVGTHRTVDHAMETTSQPEVGNRNQGHERESLEPETGTPGPYTERRIRALLDADKEMALIRIAIEIERTINILLQQRGIAIAGPGYSINRAASELVRAGEVTGEVAQALTQFQRVRNEIVHARRAVPESAITSVIQSGLELLLLLDSKIQRS